MAAHCLQGLVEMAIKSTQITGEDASKTIGGAEEQTYDNVKGAYAAILVGCLCRGSTVSAA